MKPGTRPLGRVNPRAGFNNYGWDCTRKIINNLNKRKEVSPFYQENVGGPPDQNPNYSPCTLFLCENLFRFCSFLLLDLDGSSLQNTSVLDAHAKLINGSYMYGGNSSLFTTPLSSSLILISWFGYAFLSHQDIAKEATWKCFFLKH